MFNPKIDPAPPPPASRFAGQIEVLRGLLFATRPQTNCHHYDQSRGKNYQIEQCESPDPLASLASVPHGYPVTIRGNILIPAKIAHKPRPLTSLWRDGTDGSLRATSGLYCELAIPP